MRVVGDFNKISEELKPRPLEQGEIVMYEVLNGTMEIDNTIGEDGKPISKFTGKKIYPAATRIPTRDRIKDPYTNSYVEIGVVETVDFRKNIVEKIKAFFVTGNSRGTVAFVGGNIEDEEMYEYFELCNYNESNPHRDQSKPAIFKRLDLKKESEKRSRRIDRVADALQYVRDLPATEVREFAASLNWDFASDVEILHGDLREFAYNSPEAFLKMVGDPDVKRKAELKRAFTAGFIKYDVNTHKVLWGHNDVSIAQLDRVPGVNYLDQFNDWVKTNKNGDNILKNLRTQLRGDIREKVKEANKEAQSQ